MSGAETARCPVVQRRIGGAEMALPPPPRASQTHKFDNLLDLTQSFDSLLIELNDVHNVIYNFKYDQLP